MKELRDLLMNFDFNTATSQDVEQVCDDIQNHPEFKANSVMHVFYTHMLVNAINSGNPENFERVCALNCPGLKDDFNYPRDITNALHRNRNAQMRPIFLRFLGQCSEDMQNTFAHSCFGGEQYRTMLDDIVQQPQTPDVYRAFARAALVDGSVNYALSVVKICPEVLSALHTSPGSGVFYNRRLEHVEEQYEQWEAQRQNEVLRNATERNGLSQPARKI